MTPQDIYAPLRSGGLTRAGALAAIGNFMAETGPDLRPDRPEIGSTNLSPEQYTRMIDEGRLDFENGRGYGLAQWTYGQRKNWLLSFAKKYGVSVGDGAMQIDFFLWECREYYPAVWKTITTSDDIDECSDIICRVYENPKVCNYATRRAYAHAAESQTWEVEEDPQEPAGDIFVMLLQICMRHDGYWTKPVDGIKTAEFRAKIIEYATDVAKT